MKSHVRRSRFVTPYMTSFTARETDHPRDITSMSVIYTATVTVSVRAYRSESVDAERERVAQSNNLSLVALTMTANILPDKLDVDLNTQVFHNKL